jgi:hypothetical protein
MKLALVAFLANLLWGGACVKPTTTIRSVDSPFVLSSAMIAALATAHLAYEESLLSPERIVRSPELRPLAIAKGCIDEYMAPFVQSQVKSIRESASTIQLAMDVLSNNEQEVYEEVARMSTRRATQQEIVAYLEKYLDSGQGRWYTFLNAATSTIFSIGVFENPKSEKPVVLSALQPDEVGLLRLEISRHFLLNRLMEPSRLRPSPQKAAAMLYRFLKDGKIALSDAEWQ